MEFFCYRVCRMPIYTDGDVNKGRFVVYAMGLVHESAYSCNNTAMPSKLCMRLIQSCLYGNFFNCIVNNAILFIIFVAFSCNFSMFAYSLHQHNVYSVKHCHGERGEERAKMNGMWWASARKRSTREDKKAKAFINMHSGGTISYKTDVKNYLFRHIRRLCIVYLYSACANFSIRIFESINLLF